MVTYFCPSCGSTGEASGNNCSCGAQHIVSAPPILEFGNEPDMLKTELGQQAVHLSHQAGDGSAFAAEVVELKRCDEVIDAVLVVDEDDGLWRDGKWLVISNSGVRFPERCVKTNDPGCKPSQPLVLHEPNPSQVGWVLAFGLLGALLSQANSPSTTIQPPISARWLAEDKYRGRIGWRIICAGIVGFILITLIAIAAPNLEGGAFACLMAGLALCPLISISGMIYLVRNHNPILNAKKITRHFTWVDGVCQEYLGQLPSWPGPHLGRGMI